MKHKLKEAIKEWNYEELRAFEKEMNIGGREIKKVLWERMREMENSTKFCTTCFSELDPYETTFTLIFGPEDFRKKASFCAVDCLEYFLTHVKDIEKAKKRMKVNKNEKG